MVSVKVQNDSLGNCPLLSLTLSGGGAFICGEPLPIYLGDAVRQSAARRQVFLRLPGQAGGRHEDNGPGCAAHLENQQAWLGGHQVER